MSAASKVRPALDAADMFLTALCEGRVPPCFTPKNEAIALGLNAALPLLRLLGFPARRGLMEQMQLKKVVELRDAVKDALAELNEAEARKAAAS